MFFINSNIENIYTLIFLIYIKYIKNNVWRWNLNLKENLLEIHAKMNCFLFVTWKTIYGGDSNILYNAGIIWFENITLEMRNKNVIIYIKK